jgi:hypothetical protein
VLSESRCVLRLRYLDLVISIEVAVEVCCCFTGILIFKGLTRRRLYKSFGVKGLNLAQIVMFKSYLESPLVSKCKLGVGAEGILYV